MAYYDDSIHPVTRITAGSIGEPGLRVFILQAHVDGQVVSWLIEKEQAVALGQSLPDLLTEIQEEFPELGEPLMAAKPNLALSEPVRPEFRVGGIELGYDRLYDLVILTLVDADTDLDEGVDLSPDAAAQGELHIFTTRGQALLLGQQAKMVVAAGRPYCPNCGEPIDSFGHFCLPATARTHRSGQYVH